MYCSGDPVQSSDYDRVSDRQTVYCSGCDRVSDRQCSAVVMIGSVTVVVIRSVTDCVLQWL